MPASLIRVSSPFRVALVTLLLIGGSATPSSSDVALRVVDVPTRPEVLQRFLFLSPQAPKAIVILFAGGHGGLQIATDGRLQWGIGNFLIRSRQLFVERDLAVAIVDAPSDRQRTPFLAGFRQTPEHATDIKAVIAWLREHVGVPVWLVGTSSGTQSVGYLATQLTGREGPDGIVLTSTVLTDGGRPVPAMELDRVRIPVLVVHHEQDGCSLCLFRDVPTLMRKLDAVPTKELIAHRRRQPRRPVRGLRLSRLQRHRARSRRSNRRMDPLQVAGDRPPPTRRRGRLLGPPPTSSQDSAGLLAQLL